MDETWLYIFLTIAVMVVILFGLHRIDEKWEFEEACKARCVIKYHAESYFVKDECWCLRNKHNELTHVKKESLK